MSIVIQLLKLGKDVPTPAYGTSMSACFDLSFQPCERFSIQGYDKWNRPCDRMTYNDAVDIYPGDRILVPTGLIMRIRGDMTQDILATYSIRLHARSGMSLKQGLVLANAEGVVDVDYQKEIFVMLTNISEVPVQVKKGDRIAQAEVVQNHICYFELVNSIKPHGERDGGFGSTGHN
jgi:dUTP pyrophosphatase